MREVSGSRTLHRLIYYSRQMVQGEAADAEVDQIIRGSIGSNRAAGLTGLLLVHDGWFLQVIEGQREVLDRLLSKLETDPRHRNISVIDRTPVSDRRFADWSMANARITPSLKTALDRLATDPETQPGRIIDMLHEAAQPA